MMFGSVEGGLCETRTGSRANLLGPIQSTRSPQAAVRRSLLILLAVLAVLASACSAGTSHPRNKPKRTTTTSSIPKNESPQETSQASPPRGIPNAETISGVKTVGALFPTFEATGHYCTASVVDSDSQDLLITAAHCVIGNGTTMQFAPDYANGKAPLGRWSIEAAYVSPQWIADQNPDYDFAFLKVAPVKLGDKEVQIQQLTGANELVFSRIGPKSTGTKVEVIGYPLAVGGSPIVCSSSIEFSHGFPYFLCHGFVDGTSGSPFLMNWSASTHTGEVVGVIGGLHQGGCHNWRSYSAPWGNSVRKLYLLAEAGGPGDVAPKLGPDGCPS
jgi:V8-like Glu-specific endopeptidase